jgi:hypothetical protein
VCIVVHFTAQLRSVRVSQRIVAVLIGMAACAAGGTKWPKPHRGMTRRKSWLVVTVAFMVVIFLWMFFPPKSDQGATAVLNTLVGTLGGRKP